MPKTREYQFPRRNATEEQSSSGYLRRMGSWLHGPFPNVGAMRIHLGGSGLHVQMGRSTSFCCGRFKELQENVPGNHISSLWSSESRDKWRRLTLHQKNLQEVPQQARSRSLGCHNIPSPNKWSSRDLEQRNQVHSAKRRSMPWGRDGRTIYLRHYGLIGQLSKHW